MINVLFFFLYVLGVQAQSDPSALSGVYRFQSSLKPLHRVQVEVLYWHDPSTENRLKELRAEGYSCDLYREAYRCMRSRGWSGPVRDRDVENFKRQYGALEFRFLEPTATPRIVSKGPIFNEWMVNSGVQLPDQQIISNYQFLVYHNQHAPLVKVLLNSDWELLYYGQAEPLMMMADVTESRQSGYDTYYYFLVLEQP